jgi:hypothetical protein
LKKVKSSIFGQGKKGMNKKKDLSLQIPLADLGRIMAAHSCHQIEKNAAGW